MEKLEYLPASWFVLFIKYQSGQTGRMCSAKHDESIGEKITCRDLVENPEGKRPVVIPKSIWKRNIKIYLTETG